MLLLAAEVEVLSLGRMRTVMAKLFQRVGTRMAFLSSNRMRIGIRREKKERSEKPLLSVANDEGEGKAGVCIPIWRGLKAVLEVGVEDFVDGIVGKPDGVVVEKVAGVKQDCCTSVWDVPTDSVLARVDDKMADNRGDDKGVEGFPREGGVSDLFVLFELLLLFPLWLMASLSSLGTEVLGVGFKRKGKIKLALFVGSGMTTLKFFLLRPFLTGGCAPPPGSADEKDKSGFIPEELEFRFWFSS